MSEPIPDDLDEQDFFEVMQCYRWAGLVRGGGEEADVVRAFEAVKDWIRAHHASALRAALEQIEKQQAEIAGTAVAIAELADCLRAAEAQKERCAGLTAGEWRALFIKTQDQWQAAEAEVKCLKRLIYGE